MMAHVILAITSLSRNPERVSESKGSPGEGVMAIEGEG